MTVTVCVLLAAAPGREADLGRYEDAVLALLADHDARIVGRWRAGDGIHAEVQILEFASAERLERFQADPRRTALSGLREASVASTTVIALHPIG